MNILDKISEEEVTEWIKAKLAGLQKSMPPIHCIELKASDLKGTVGIYHSWTGFACGCCVLQLDRSSEIVPELREELGADHRKMASERRLKAEQLLEEASELEKLSQSEAA